MTPFDAGVLGRLNQSPTGVYLGGEITTPRVQAVVQDLVDDVAAGPRRARRGRPRRRARTDRARHRPQGVRRRRSRPLPRLGAPGAARRPSAGRPHRVHRRRTHLGARSRQGESDFHALTALAPAGALGWDGALRRSADGLTWELLDIPAEPHTLAAAPQGTIVLATTAQGLLRSTDAGDTWTPVQGAPLLHVVTWTADGSVAAGVDPGGTLWLSADGGGSWQQGAQLGAAPQAVAAAVGRSRWC